MGVNKFDRSIQPAKFDEARERQKMFSPWRTSASAALKKFRDPVRNTISGITIFIVFALKSRKNAMNAEYLHEISSMIHLTRSSPVHLRHVGSR